jgi:hypothetical protein
MTLIRRWWWLGIPVAPIVLALLTGITIRLMGEADLAAVRREIAAAGQPADYAAWRVTIPPADAERGEALRRVLREFQGIDIVSKERDLERARLPFWEPKTTTATAAAKRLAMAATRAAAHAQRVATMSAELAAVYARSQALLDDLKPLLTAGPPVPITATWRLPQDPDQGKAWFNADDVHANLLETRSALAALAHSASTAGDPATDFQAMRVLVRCARLGPGAIDQMLASSLLRISDQYHFQALRQGRLPVLSRDEWLADCPDLPEPARSSLVTDRISGMLWRARTMTAPLSTLATGSDGADAWDRVWGWLTEPRFQATWEWTMHRLSTTTAILSPAQIATGWPGSGRIDDVPTTMQTTQIVALTADAEARIFRTAAIVLLHADRETDAAISARIAPLLTGAPGRIRLGWERLGMRRVRVGMDHRVPQPVPASWFVVVPGRGLGTPAHRTADPDQIAHNVLEFDLP